MDPYDPYDEPKTICLCLGYCQRLDRGVRPGTRSGSEPHGATPTTGNGYTDRRWRSCLSHPGGWAISPPSTTGIGAAAAREIGFEGTSLLPQAKGSASVTSQQQTSVEAKFEGLVPANSFGEEYLTYVLWAITPQGRPMNLGEIIPSGSKAEARVTTGLQQFALIVTAEPYFAVTTPSDLVVLQNTIKKNRTNPTTGIIDILSMHTTTFYPGAPTWRRPANTRF